MTDKTPEELMLLAEQDAIRAHEAKQHEQPLTRHYDSLTDSAERNYQFSQIMPEADPIVEARMQLPGGGFTTIKVARQQALDEGMEILTPDVIQQASLRHPEDVAEEQANKPAPKAAPSAEQISALSQLELEGYLTPEIIAREAAKAGMSSAQLTNHITQQKQVATGKIMHMMSGMGVTGDAEEIIGALQDHNPDAFKAAVMTMQEGQGTAQLRDLMEHVREANINEIYKNPEMSVRMLEDAGENVKLIDGTIMVFEASQKGYVPLEKAIRDGVFQVSLLV